MCIKKINVERDLILIIDQSDSILLIKFQLTSNISGLDKKKKGEIVVFFNIFIVFIVNHY